jgi:hypothetical protein
MLLLRDGEERAKPAQFECHRKIMIATCDDDNRNVRFPR